MRFEYDQEKSLANKVKHGIDFNEAQKLWSDPEAIVVPAKTVGEETRYALIGMIRPKCYAAIFTMREQHYRIISVRRCRKKEEHHYEEAKRR